MNLKRTCILFVNYSIISNKKNFNVKVGDAKVLEFQLEIGQNVFFTLEHYYVYFVNYNMSRFGFKIPTILNYIKHQSVYAYNTMLYNSN
jgi:hypothetical protein